MFCRAMLYVMGQAGCSRMEFSPRAQPSPIAVLGGLLPWGGGLRSSPSVPVGFWFVVGVVYSFKAFVALHAFC